MGFGHASRWPAHGADPQAFVGMAITTQADDADGHAAASNCGECRDTAQKTYIEPMPPLLCLDALQYR